MNGVIKVEIDGKTHDELSKGCVLEGVEVDQKLNDHWWATISIRQTEDQRFPAEECLGKSLKLTAVDQTGEAYVLFDGGVLDSEIEFEIYGSYVIRLTGVTRSYRLDLRDRHKYYRKKSMEDVANELADDHGLKAEVKEVTAKGWDPKRKLNYCQWGQCDWKFILGLADDNWAWVRPTSEGFEIRGAFDKGVKLTWRAHQGLLNFAVKGQIGTPGFNGSHYDIRKREVALHVGIKKDPETSGAADKMFNAVKDQSKANLGPAAVALESRAPSPKEFEQLLEKESVRSIGSKTVGRGSSRNPGVRAGNEVEIEGMELSGIYYVTSVTHSWTPAGYVNNFLCTPWKTYFSPERPEAPRIHGVAPATVISHNDPRRLGRIQIQYEWQEEGETGWARMVYPHAGDGRGFILTPEKGDEVLIAFEHGDPERPYIVGCLFNGINAQPKEGFRDDSDQEKGGSNEDLEENYIKKLVFKSGVGQYFNDKPGNEAISMHVPGGLHVIMTHNNPESPGRSLIMLHNENGDIVLNAPNGRIHAHSKYSSREIGQ